MIRNEQMEEFNVFQIISKYNLIVPEIQREYVWGNNDFNILDLFFNDIEEGANLESSNQKNKLQNLKEELLKKISQDDFNSVKKEIDKFNSSQAINIGFLYSYRPSYYIYNDVSEDVYLIDGQQRFTTLFLSLFFFALKEDKKDIFLQLFRFNPKKEKIAFDYRVRKKTHNFFIDLLNHCNTLDDVLNITEQTWFLSDYSHDVTIKAMVKTINKLNKRFPRDEQTYYDFLLKKVKFWHFKTEATSQGEELYITMNSRGKVLADNESIRAKLFEQIKVSKKTREWNQKWEEWQDFFWKHKNGNENADDGFNEFLRCISGLENYLSGKEENFYSPKEYQDNGIKASSLIANLNLDLISKYFLCYKFLIENKDQLKKGYTHLKWIDRCINRINILLNNQKTNWFADYKNDNRATERNYMVYVWSLLYYLSRVDLEKENLDEVCRTLRLYYVRYNNFIRSVTSIKKNIDEIKRDGVWNANSEFKDEKEKHYFLLNISNDQVKKYEEIIWKIEDHPYNLKAKDLGNVNISHIVDFSVNPSFEDILLIKQKFFELFPVNEVRKGIVNTKDLKTVLLHYGKYWYRVSPWYYTNLNFGDWKRIIRNLDGDKTSFKLFFDDFKNKNLTDLKNELQNKFISKYRNELVNNSDILPEMELREQLIIYSLLTDIWTKGDYIAIYEDLPEDERRLFKNEKQEIYNTQSNFRGNYGNIKLWDMIKDDYKQKIKELVKNNN